MDDTAPQPADESAGAEQPATATPPTPEERRAERIAKRKAAEADMTWEEIRASKQARAAQRRERLAALPEEEREKKEAELAKAKQERLANRPQS